MSNATEELPDDLASALALLAQERARRVAAEAEAATAKAEAASAKALVSHSEALIARLKLEIDKVRRELYGSRSEHVDSDDSPDGIPIKNRTRFRELTGRDSDLIPDSLST